MNSDIVIILICGLILSISVLYMLYGFIYNIFCNSRIYSTPYNATNVEITNHITIEINSVTTEKIDNDEIDNLPVAYLVKY